MKSKTIEDVLNGTEFEKYIKKLKINGFLDLDDIFLMKKNSKLAEMLRDSIENEDDIIKLMGLLDKEIHKQYHKNTLDIGVKTFITLGILFMIIYWILSL